MEISALGKPVTVVGTMRVLVSVSLFCSAIQALRCPRWSQNADQSAVRSLILNKYGYRITPRRYRASTDSFSKHFDTYLSKPHLPPLPPPAMVGYAETRMSGSSQFGLHQLKRLPRNLPLIVVDLRMEAHGFIDDLPVSFFCPKNWDRLDVPPRELAGQEQRDLKRLKKRGWVKAYRKLPNSETIGRPRIIRFKRVRTQAEALAHHGIRYERIPIPDHRRPRDEQITQLITLFEAMAAEPHWMHFHCQAGKGRTTTAMIMWDMFQNAGRLALEDILHRNYIYSKIHLDDLRSIEDSYRRPFVEERTLFLRAFYQYCRHRSRTTRGNWTSFLASQLDVLLYRAIVVAGHWMTLKEGE